MFTTGASLSLSLTSAFGVFSVRGFLAECVFQSLLSILHTQRPDMYAQWIKLKVHNYPFQPPLGLGPFHGRRRVRKANIARSCWAWQVRGQVGFQRFHEIYLFIAQIWSPDAVLCVAAQFVWLSLNPFISLSAPICTKEGLQKNLTCSVKRFRILLDLFKISIWWRVKFGKGEAH